MVDPAQAIDIGRDGVVSQGGQEIGQIEIDTIDDQQGSPEKLAHQLFCARRDVGP